MQSVKAADLQYFYPGALALGPSGAVAIGGGRWDVPGALAASLAVSVSRSFDAAFLPAARLAPATVAPPSVPITQGPAVGSGPGNTAIAATNTLECLVGTESPEPCSPGVAGSTLQVWLWPASAAAPTAPILPSSARFAYLPVVVTSGSTTWIAWYEGATDHLDTLAVAKVAAHRLGTVRRLKLATSERASQELRLPRLLLAALYASTCPRARRSPASAHRRDVPDGTVRHDRHRGPRRVYAGPNTRQGATPATGLGPGSVGWTSWDDKRGARARSADH